MITQALRVRDNLYSVGIGMKVKRRMLATQAGQGSGPQSTSLVYLLPLAIDLHLNMKVTAWRLIPSLTGPGYRYLNLIVERVMMIMVW